MIADTQSVAAARVVLLGCGRVGSAVARRLLDPNRAPALRGIELAGVLVRSTSRDGARHGALDDLRAAGVPVVTSFDALLACRPQVAIEVIGGREAPLPFVASLLSRGIPVVTANKSLVAAHGSALARLSLEHGAQLRAEAAVGAAVPILAALRQRSGDRLRSIQAVLNGTCNFVLERMERTGCSLEEAVRDAQALGLAEPDPSADLSGRDAAEKLAVLALVAGLESSPDPHTEPHPGAAGACGVALGPDPERRTATFERSARAHPCAIDPECIPTSGIERLTPEILREAARRGEAIRLVASFESRGDAPPWLEVAPVLLERRHPLAALRGAENGILLDSDPGGPLFLRGLGAGPDATASALLGDMLAVAPRVPRRRVGSGVAKVNAGRSNGSLAAASSAVALAVAPRRSHRVRLRAGACTPAATLAALSSGEVECVDAEFHANGADLRTAPISAERHAELLSIARRIDPDASVLAVG